MISDSTDRLGPTATVHLLRHGLVENPRGILYGQLPGFHLSEVGRKMAERIAERYCSNDINQVVASPLERAQETAAPLAEKLGLPVNTDRRLIEPHNIFEGTVFGVGDGVLRRPSNWRKVRDPFTPSWGEAYLSIARRMLGAVYAAADAADGHEAMLVSHQLPIWTLRRFLNGKRLWHNPAKRQCALASVTSFEISDGVLRRIRYAEPAADLVPSAQATSMGA